MPSAEAHPVRVFVSYSHADRKWLERLLVHLKPLREICSVEPWDDTRIKPGSSWKKEIRKAVDEASVAILIISADFLASDFIRTDELPPLLKAAEEEGTVILPIIVSPCLFSRMQHLSQFQAINDPALPLVSLGVGDQEAAFVRVADAILAVTQNPTVERTKSEQAAEPIIVGENFLDVSTWNRLLKIGDWIFDETKSRIIGAGTNAFLVSREEYGAAPFQVHAKLEFSNFSYPIPERQLLGMNAGLLFGWKDEKQRPRYYNVLLTGTEILLERIGFESPGKRPRRHVTDAVPFRIEPSRPISLLLRVNESHIQVETNGQQLIAYPRPTGVVGRVGLRPWRSKLDCAKFVVSAATPVG